MVVLFAPNEKADLFSIWGLNMESVAGVDGAGVEA